MKTRILKIWALFILILSVGCNEETKETNLPKVLKANTAFEASGGSGSIELSLAPEKAEVITGSEWCSVSLSGAVVNITIQKNVYMMGRSALIVASYSNMEDVIFPVSQAGASIVPVFKESWEAYDGSPAWLSDVSGWSIEKNDASSITWDIDVEVPGYLGSEYATDGDYLALIGFEVDEEEGGILPQDQALISPAFTVGSSNQFSFDYAYAPIWMYFDGDFHFDAPLFTLKVEISIDNGQNWTELFDAAQAAEGKYDEDNIFDYLDPIWGSVKLDFSGYAGKEVKIAFHSIGTFPDYIGVDNISIGISKESVNPPVKKSKSVGSGISLLGKKMDVTFKNGKYVKSPVK
jgi:hypothetical protein